MRITGHRILELVTTGTSDAIGEVARSALIAGTGRRLERPSEDPRAWLAAHRAGALRAVHDGAGRAIGLGRGRLVQTDAALATIGDAVARARELAIQATNDTLNAADRSIIATELRAVFATALAAANARSVEGDYLLAGHAVTAAPFDATGAYVGDAGARELLAGDGQRHAITVAGTELTAAAGVDVLPTIDQLVTALAANDVASARILIGDLDRAGDQVSVARAHAGALGAALDDADRVRIETQLGLDEAIAAAVDADAAAAASDLTRAGTALETVRAVAARVVALVAPPRG